MRVAVITGAARALVNFRGPLIATMAERGHDVLTLSPDDHPGISEKLAAVGARWSAVDFQRAGSNPLAELRLAAQLTRKLRSENAELALSYTVKGALWGSLAAMAARVPYRYAAITGLGHLFTDDTRGGAVRRAMTIPLLRVALRNCTRVFFQNPDDIQEFVDRGIVKQKSTVLVAGSGVDLERFPPVEFRPGPISFLFVGRFLRDKGLIDLFDAVELMRQRGYAPPVRIVGGNFQNPTTLDREFIETRTGELDIEVIGWTERIQDVLAECHVLVLPSYREGTPRSCLEAMATGRALIVTDVPGCREVVNDGENGLLVPVRDPARLADAMMQMIDDRPTVERMAQAGLALARSKYDVNLVNEHMLSVMDL